MTTLDELNRLAREMYFPRAPHWPGCGELVNLADELRFLCPHCNKRMLQGVAPEVTPERAAEMLIELGARRESLGLPPMVEPRSPKSAQLK